MVRRFVWSRNLVNEEAPAHWGLLRQKQKIDLLNEFVIIKKKIFFELCIKRRYIRPQHLTESVKVRKWKYVMNNKV